VNGTGAGGGGVGDGVDALVLALLVEAEGEPLSGQAICEKLDLPRRALLQTVDSLRSRGFLIAAGPGWGYRIAGLPDGLSSKEIHPLLGTSELGRKLHFFDSLPSTNDAASRLAEEGAAHGEVVIAEQQTAGKGRRGRGWVTPPGKSLALSVVLRPQLPPARAPELTLVAAVAVCEAARELGAPDASIKWPNDVEVAGRKLAGLLLELRAEGDRVLHVVLGVGVNVNTAAQDLPDELRPTATSLRIERGEPVPRGLFCARLLGRLEDWLGLHEALGLAPVIERWQQLSSTLGRPVRVELGDGQRLEGRAIDLDETGALLVRVGSGAVHRVVAGDVEHLRT
jgi:BirA family biotin operon repressor/biotin-[acetyl-CoA-carboxylase] ligase